MVEVFIQKLWMCQLSILSELKGVLTSFEALEISEKAGGIDILAGSTQEETTQFFCKLERDAARIGF